MASRGGPQQAQQRAAKIKKKSSASAEVQIRIAWFRTASSTNELREIMWVVGAIYYVNYW